MNDTNQMLQKEIKDFYAGSSSTKIRDSNLELYRILTMLLIIAHHYVVNSGLTNTDGQLFRNLISLRSQFLLMFGAFGKTGINCFLLITGYFMCKSEISSQKFGKLLFEVMFYRITIYLIFWLTGYERITLSSIFSMVIPFSSIEQNFTGCYLMFFLFIPFLNLLICHMNEKQHFKLLILTGFMYVLFETLPFLSISINYVSWYMVIYLLASYIRLYPKKLFSNAKLWGCMTMLSILLSLLSIVVFSMRKSSLGDIYSLVSDSNAFLAVATAFSSFLFFKNLRIRRSRIINTIAASTFGVLCIHAHSSTMRRWLWMDLLKNTSMYSSAWMPVHAIGSALGVFFTCVIIDQLRIRYFEKSYMRLWNKIYESAVTVYIRLENAWMSLK